MLRAGLVFALCSCLAPRLPGSPPWSDKSKFAFAGLVNVSVLPSGIRISAGSVSKHPAPLLVQDRPWEPRLDNGYPNVVHVEGDPHGAWQLWYGGCTQRHSCENQVLEYANSSDGLTWEKPNLGLFNVSNYFPNLSNIGTENNIVMSGGGIGIYRDVSPFVTDNRERYKAYGEWGGTRVSPDGFTWSQTDAISFNRTPDGHQAYDCHNNLIWDPGQENYLMTTRWYLDMGKDIRNIGLFQSASSKFSDWPSVVDPVLNGTQAHQLYSQITFPFYNLYLGLVMVFDTANPEKVGTVECRLSWSADSPHGSWSIVGGVSNGSEAIPRGPSGSFDSHIIFAAAHPVPLESSIRLYYMGGDGPHNGPRNSSLGLAELRSDGFIAISGTGSFETVVPVLCTGAKLILTADVVSDTGSVRIGVVGEERLSADTAEAVVQNTTDSVASWSTGADLSHLIGQTLLLEIKLQDALLYTVGFRQGVVDDHTQVIWM